MGGAAIRWLPSADLKANEYWSGLILEAYDLCRYSDSRRVYHLARVLRIMPAFEAPDTSRRRSCRSIKLQFKRFTMHRATRLAMSAFVQVAGLAVGR